MTAALFSYVYSTAFTVILVAGGMSPAPEARAEPLTPSKLSAEMQIAQKSKKRSKSRKKKKRRGVRKKILSSEAGSKKGQSTKIDFDEASIDGRRRAPMGVAINKNKGDDDYDLIKLRLKWHQEMVDSAANLETGKNR